MKLLATGSLKFAKLKRRLKLSHWQTVGVLESIWLFVQHNCPDGAIGRFSDEDIAAGIEWGGPAGDLVDALTESGWLDPCEGYRLLVHDWEDHCPTYIKGNFVKHGKTFAKQPAKDGAKDGAKQSAKDGAIGATTLPRVGEANGDTNTAAGKRPTFVRPTVEEIAQFCHSTEIQLDCHEFWDFYQSCGWKVGNKPMKDWQAAARNWARRDRKESPSSGKTVDDLYGPPLNKRPA